jgi:hypothetical protein
MRAGGRFARIGRAPAAGAGKRKTDSGHCLQELGIEYQLQLARLGFLALDPLGLKKFAVEHQFELARLRSPRRLTSL